MPYSPPSFAGLDNPVREVLDQSWSDIQVNATSANNSVANSADLQVAVQWDHGTRTVEVRLESTVVINGVSQAAGLKVGSTMYICDLTLASNGLYTNPYNASMSALSSVYHVFHDTTTGAALGVWNTVVAHVEAAPGTTISLSGRAYQSLASAATWSSLHGYFSPIVMTARELL